MCTNNTQIFVKSDRYSNKTDTLPVFNDITMKPRSVDVQNLKSLNEILENNILRTNL